MGCCVDNNDKYDECFCCVESIMSVLNIKSIYIMHWSYTKTVEKKMKIFGIMNEEDKSHYIQFENIITVN